MSYRHAVSMPQGQSGRSAQPMEHDIRDLLAKAGRARVLGRACDHKIVCANLNRYAAELEAEAVRLGAEKPH
jgi:hypothetical protein